MNFDNVPTTGTGYSECREDRRVIKSASELYPGEHPDFIEGFDAWLSGTFSTRLLWYSTTHFKRGYWKARNNSAEMYLILK